MLIHPIKFATARLMTKGEFPLANFDRLAAACQQELMGVVHYELVGDADWSGTLYLQLKVSAVIPQRCQRCLKPFNMTLKNEVKLSPVFSESDAEKLPAEFDPLLLTEDAIDLAAVVEDELLLLVPPAPMHDLKDCSVKETSWNFGKSQNDQEKEHPFAKLKNLKEE